MLLFDLIDALEREARTGGSAPAMPPLTGRVPLPPVGPGLPPIFPPISGTPPFVPWPEETWSPIFGLPAPQFPSPALHPVRGLLDLLSDASDTQPMQYSNAAYQPDEPPTPPREDAGPTEAPNRPAKVPTQYPFNQADNQDWSKWRSPDGIMAEQAGASSIPAYKNGWDLVPTREGTVKFLDATKDQLGLAAVLSAVVPGTQPAFIPLATLATLAQAGSYLLKPTPAKTVVDSMIDVAVDTVPGIPPLLRPVIGMGAQMVIDPYLEKYLK